VVKVKDPETDRHELDIDMVRGEEKFSVSSYHPEGMLHEAKL
jgi:hypothetical protein